MRKHIKQSEHSRLGFTMLELMIVISIIAVLMSMSFYVMNGITEVLCYGTAVKMEKE